MSKHEKRILKALLSALRKAGYQPAAVWTNEDYQVAGGASFDKGAEPDTIAKPMTNGEVLKVFEDYDMYCPTVHFTHKNSLKWGYGIMVVEGNGCDFISDWHCGDSEDIKGFDAVVDRIATLAGDGKYE